jgi:hypothetical protein
MKVLAISTASVVIAGLMLVLVFQLGKLVFTELKEMISEAWHSPET